MPRLPASTPKPGAQPRSASASRIPAKSPAAAKPARRAADTSPRLVVRSSDIHAAGCYTLAPIRRGAQVLEYDGPRISKKVADELYAGRPVTYLFGFGEKGDVIDGFCTAMFINHSCAPNCETEERDERIFITALRDIAAGEELLYEYHLYDSDLDDTAACYCGAPGCRGTMYSEKEIKRRERLIKRRDGVAA